MARNRLVSPSQRIRNRHKCTCEPFYQSPTRSEEPPSYTEYCEEDEFTDAEDAIQERQDHEDKDDFADSGWDEQAILIALLDDREDSEEAPKFVDGVATVDRLSPALLAHRRQVIGHFRKTLVSVVTRVEQVHKSLSHHKNPTILRGVALFDKSSKALEDAARREHDQVVRTFTRVKETIGDLSLQLQDVCAESDKLLDSYERAVDEHGILS
ncbi:uncharacterized protein F5891DRAFT_1194526 [Suillus fuscotomentosus]|jgi:hypothetical protein|uniref:Uncharacterized protein n=1 Tax=Suillus fuscotomentosus TaxID=1912939 RepID=A0AAD4HH06_9AGAM|nr:uncharacterized protein F5891DRAFT_1194526 [Suillus fuscotomentosus]KAG1895169.1 hypothetical protein F5891DRAFT_1194526 [Suillus fuscotomentosus]